MWEGDPASDLDARHIQAYVSPFPLSAMRKLPLIQREGK